jgi:hypothetical protein
MSVVASAVSRRALALVRQWKWLGRCCCGVPSKQGQGCLLRLLLQARPDNSKHPRPGQSSPHANPQTPSPPPQTRPIEGSDTDTPTHHTTYHIRDSPTRDRRLLACLLASLLACEPRFPAAHPATPTSINNQSQQPPSPPVTHRYIFPPRHPTRLHSLLSTRGSRNDGQLCSRPALSPTSH